MRKTFNIGISLFFSALTAGILAVLVLASGQGLQSLEAVMDLSGRLQRGVVPDMLESQRIFVNMESLRRTAEVVYVADDPQVRRAARINAQALAAESVFSRNSGFHARALHIAGLITTLAKYKDELDAHKKRLAGTRREYEAAMQFAVTELDSPRQSRTLLDAFSHSGVNQGALDVSGSDRSEGQKLDASDDLLFARMDLLCSEKQRVEAWVGECRKLKTLEADYLGIRGAIKAATLKTRAYWEDLDLSLRQMRDDMSTDYELVGEELLTLITGSVNTAQNTYRYMLLTVLAFAAIFLFLVHRYIVKPIKWTAQKLAEVQDGDLHVDMPNIRIKELRDVAGLLDRFSSHLSDLYSHTSQLEEDAANNKYLEEVMHAVFQASPDGYLVWDDQSLIMSSPGLLKLLGVNSQEELRANMPALGFAGSEEKRRIFDQVMGLGTIRTEKAFYNMSGETLPVEITHIRVRQRSRNTVLTCLRDLRGQKRNEETLRQAKEQAEEGAKAKSNFLARMSHEIRTPMNGVLGLTKLALNHSPPPDQREYLNKIQSSANILLGVINDILDFSKIESGNLNLENEPFDFSSMLRTIYDLFKAQAEQKKLRFAMRVDPQIPQAVRGDSLRLSQVLLNLCGNALKFTEKGHVELEVRLLEKSAGKARILFAVKDSGPGIAEERIARLFEPFTQEDVSTTRKYGGTGLGLAISKLLVELMGGTLTAASVLGQGSTFSFSVNLEIAESANLPESEAPAAAGQFSFAGRNILLVEDNEINQEIAKTLLEDLGVNVTLAGNGREAVDLALGNAFDCILMDIQMPVLDGLSAAKLIRGQDRPDLRQLPIIAMTAHAMQEDREKSFQAGMNDHITKPINFEELQAKLRQWLAAG